MEPNDLKLTLPLFLWLYYSDRHKNACTNTKRMVLINQSRLKFLLWLISNPHQLPNIQQILCCCVAKQSILVCTVTGLIFENFQACPL